MRFLECGGEAYHKAAALSVLLTYHKLRDNLEDDSFWKSLGSRIFLPVVSRKAKRAAEEFPFLAQEAQRAMEGQREAEASGGSVDACAEPTGQMLAALFRELAGDDKVQAIPLERFGYFLGRWIYLMDAADDLADDLKEGAFNPWIDRLGLEGKKELSPEERKKADQACNQALNATAAQMVLAFNLISLVNFGPILENVVHQGLPEIQREILFLHIRDRKRDGNRNLCPERAGRYFVGTTAGLFWGDALKARLRIEPQNAAEIPDGRGGKPLSRRISYKGDRL